MNFNITLDKTYFESAKQEWIRLLYLASNQTGKRKAKTENQMAELAHKIYASSDFILMPSLYEPCGISQMIALKYGTIPLCTKVGGLKDTIISYNQLNIDKANGLLFDYDSNELLINLIISLNIFEKKREMNKLIHNAMNANFSWNKACEEYLRLYKQMLQKNID